MEAVGRLAGGIAHDFNNLLTAIIAFAGFVRDELPQGDQRRDDVSEILRTADRAAALTRQLLAFSRRQPIAPRNVDLNVLVASAMNLLRRTIGEDVELVARPGDALWPVFVDPGQFEQVVMNLAINARDAMPLGGRLVLETTNEARSLPDGGDEVVLRVHDDGVGMTDEVVKQIFEPFFTTKEEGKGTGLGLSMVYGLVTQAGGRISVESEVGRGTTFQIRLPRAKQLAQRPAQSSRSPAVRHGSETILVVEDELVVRRALTRLLTRGGYTVLEAENGERALSLFREKADEVDLVLSDVVMPGMNGPETVKELRRLKPETKVLFMTGYTDDTTIRHSVSREEVELITKPFSREGLLTRVRRVLEE
jgi:CheY-like chemotaxis protein